MQIFSSDIIFLIYTFFIQAALRVMEMLGFSDDEDEDDMRPDLSDDDDDFSDFVTCDSSVSKPINFPSVGDSIDYQ